MYEVMLILYDYATPNTAFAIRGIKSKVKLEFANVKSDTEKGKCVPVSYVLNAMIYR